jgi:hypothetical protein
VTRHCWLEAVLVVRFVTASDILATGGHDRFLADISASSTAVAAAGMDCCVIRIVNRLVLGLPLLSVKDKTRSTL